MKFKRNQKTKIYKKAKSAKNKQFPRNYRIIPEKLTGDGFAFLTGFLFILASIFVVSLDLYSNYTKNQALNNEKIKVQNELVFWQGEVEKRPNYRDAYFKLVLLNYQLKDFDKAKEYLKKTLNLDPNFEKGKEMEKLLNDF